MKIVRVTLIIDIRDMIVKLTFYVWCFLRLTPHNLLHLPRNWRAPSQWCRRYEWQLACSLVLLHYSHAWVGLDILLAFPLLLNSPQGFEGAYILRVIHMIPCGMDKIVVIPGKGTFLHQCQAPENSLLWKVSTNSTIDTCKEVMVRYWWVGCAPPYKRAACGSSTILHT